ncbi:cation:proton antiporter [Neorhizobium lilium]|uniref:Cation:proton antiporter n=1 Tax=Neorhizobium lilium TaxID=2503024 RepID=A0A3S3S3V9_9HYPH|nr:cation:proton antiporter [Neorhizobium lilium]RWX76049.1 cation:proton antiporter [Neorhizobium lilium]
MILSAAIWVAMLVLCLAFLLTVWRVVKGPTLPDRVVALDMLVGIVIGFIALIAIRTGFTLYIDIAISLGLVGFLATVAFARFILASPAPEGEPPALLRPAIVTMAPPQARRKPGRKEKPDETVSNRRRKSR